MAGSIRKREDRGPDAWELRIFLGRDINNRPKQRSVLFRGGKRAAEKELTRLVTLQEEDPVLIPVPEEDRRWGASTTINDAVEGWRSNGWQDLSPSTVRGYEGVWRRHVENSIGTRRIVSLGPYDIERYLRQLQENGGGQTTLRLVRALLHRACRLARKWSGNTLPNPIADTELPGRTLKDRPHPVRSPELSEVTAIMEEARKEDPRIPAFIRLVAATGCRRGEACAIRYNDIDPASRSLLIDEGIISSGGTATVKSPKTRASIRRLAIDDDTFEELAALRSVQEKLAGACGVGIRPESFVFSFEPGGSVPPHPDSMSHAFSRIRKKAGVAEDLHLHSLRHFQATILDPVISEKQKQARLGWSTVHMARHYTDAIAEGDRRAADHVGMVLRGGAAEGSIDVPQVGQQSPSDATPPAS